MAIFGIQTKKDKELSQLKDQLSQLQMAYRNVSYELTSMVQQQGRAVDETWGSPAIGYGKYVATSTDVYACQKLRADAVSSIPIKLYQRVKGKGGKMEQREIADHPVLTLLSKVNYQWTYKRLMKMTEYAQCSYGVGYWELAAPIRNMPTEIHWIHPERITPFTDGRRYVLGYDYNFEGQREWYRPEQIVAFHYPNINDQFAGLSPISVLRLGLETKHKMYRYNNAFFDNYGAPATVLKSKNSYNPGDAAAAIRSLEKVTRGADRAHSTAYIPGDLELDVLGGKFSHKDAEFIEGGRALLFDVCRVYGVPPTLVAEMSSSTYNNVETYQVALWKNTVIPALGDYDETLNERILPLFEKPDSGYFLEHDTSGVEVLREDEKAKQEIYDMKVKNGTLTVNEVRAEEGRPPLSEQELQQLQGGSSNQQPQQPQGAAAALPAPAGQASGTTTDATVLPSNVLDIEAVPEVDTGEEDLAKTFSSNNIVLWKAKGPGSKGAKFWYDDKGRVRYGPPPKGRPARTPEQWARHNKSLAREELKGVKTAADLDKLEGWESGVDGPEYDAENHFYHYGGDKDAALKAASEAAKSHPDIMYVVLKVDGNYVIAAKPLDELHKAGEKRKKAKDEQDTQNVNNADLGKKRTKKEQEEADRKAETAGLDATKDKTKKALALENRPTIKLSAQRSQFQIVYKAAKDGQPHTGIMVAFMLPPDVAQSLVVDAKMLPDGSVLSPVEELHLTLCFLGDSVETDIDKETLSLILAEWADCASPIFGKVSGIGRFNNEDANGLQALYASFDCAILQDWRRELVERLATVGIEPASDYGFTPHITLAYIPQDTPTPPIQLPKLEIEFNELCLAWGEEHRYYSLTEPEWASEPMPVYAG
jgi:HK97 family phage portal protein